MLTRIFHRIISRPNILPNPVFLGNLVLVCVCVCFRDFIIFRQRGREGEWEGQNYQCQVASHMPPTGDLARNPGMCADWESTGDSLVHKPARNLLSHTSQGYLFIFNLLILERQGEGRRERERQTDRERVTLICCFTYSHIHWLILIYVLAGDRTFKLGKSGRHSAN